MRTGEQMAISTEKSLKKSDEIQEIMDEIVDEIYDGISNGRYSSEEEVMEAIDYELDLSERDIKLALWHRLAPEFDEYMEEQNEKSASAKKSKGDDVKKSKYISINKKLNKLGGFTKEDEDDEKEEVEIEEDDGEVEVEEETVSRPKDEIEEACKGKKSRKMKKNDVLPKDADEQQAVNEKGSGSADSELPEDADENEEINEKGSGNAGKELPEDADEQEDIKESRRKSLRRGVRKFSVTNGGSPDQTSYNQRYNQNPMVRNAIDGRSNVEKFDEVEMLQARLDAMNKSRRNSVHNDVSQRLR